MKIQRIAPGGTQLTTQGPQVEKNVQAETMVTGAVSNVANVLTEGLKKFEAIRTDYEVNQAKLETYKGMEAIKTQASQDPDIDKPEVQKAYTDKMNQMKEGVLKNISLPGVRNRFAEEYDFETVKQGVALSDMGRTRLMDKTKAQTAEKIDILKGQYASAAYEDREFIMAGVNSELAALEAKGFISAEDVVKMKKGYKEEFNTKAAIKDTEIYGAEHVVNNIANYDVEDKNKLIREVKDVGLIETQKFELNQALTYQQGQKEIFGVLGDKSVDYIGKLNSIQESYDGGKIDSKTKEIAVKNLNSTNRVNAKTYTSDMADTLRVIGDLEVTFDANADLDDAKTYLKRVRDAKNMIVNLNTAGKLTDNDVKTLMAKVDSVSQTEQREAAQTLRTSGSFWSFGYSDADKYFKDNLINDAYRNEAMRMYFYASEDAKNDKDKKVIAQQVALKLKDKLLGKANLDEDLTVGTEVDGYRFNGGDRYDKNNWEKI